MKHIVIGTAGHIDHGKTALVQALTGINTDRLKEERQRGITIDIGFADLTVDGVRFSFVDVPGHEKFVKNMLAGVHGIDLVVMVIAADESVMPQTREHFDICRLLQVRSGLIALTKIDMVDDELLELAHAEVKDFVRNSFLENAPIVAVSSRTGQGVGHLKSALIDLAATVSSKSTSSLMRLPIDRVFSIKGFGSVVTGTLIGGSLEVGDALESLPAKLRTRVRNLHVHGRRVDRALAGQRVAVNLQGVDVDHIQRGDVLAPAGPLCATSIMDVRLDVLANAPRSLFHRERIRLYHGTAEIAARVALFGEPRSYETLASHTANQDLKRPMRHEVEPGQNRIVQLRLEKPIFVMPGDRFIIRSYSPIATIGGGLILDSGPEKHRLRDRAAYVNLERLEKADITGRAEIFIEMKGVRAIDEAELSLRLGIETKQVGDIVFDMVREGTVVEISRAPLVLISAEYFRLLAERTVELLSNHHRKDPLSMGMNREEVRQRLFGRIRHDIFRVVISRLADEGRITAERDILKSAAYRPILSDVETYAKLSLEAAIRYHGLQATTLEEAAGEINITAELVRKLYNLLTAEKRVIRVGEFIFHVDSIEELKERVRAQRSVSHKIDIAIFKELTGGLSRKHAIPLLEYLDRERVTRRIGNDREIL